MKKLLYSAAVLALAFFAGSCQRENLEPVAANGTVTYTVQVPGAIATKADDGVNNVDKLVYEVYRTVGEKVTAFSATDNCLYHREAEVVNGKAEIVLEFVNDQNFTVLFWAYDSSTNVYDVDDLTNVTVASTAAANTHETAAFTGVDFVINCVSEKGGNVKLTRPVAQLNIATTPESLKMDDTDITVSESYVKVYGLSTSFNVAKQEAGDATGDVTYTQAAVLGGTVKVGSKEYPNLAMNYLGFIPTEGASVKVDYLLKTSEGNIDNTIENVPVKPNYRTNIVGNLISGTQDYNVTLDAEWDGVAGEYEIWDGETLSVPATNSAGEYVVAKPSEWAYLANQQNPVTKADPVPVVINLTSNLDFGGNPLTGLVAATNNSLTVNGNGYTIMNAKVISGTVDNGTSTSALFISYSNSVLNVKNLDIKNVNVVTDENPDHGYAGVVGGYIEGTVNLENVNVYSSIVHSTQSIGGVFGFIPANGVVTVKNCTVDGVKLTNADVEGESGAMGGFVGRVAGKLTAENVKVSDSTIEAYVGTASEQKRSIAKFIGNFVGGGSIAVTGALLENVTIVAKNELAQTQSCLYTEYLGGWRGNGGTVLINGVEITKDKTNEDIIVDTPEELATAISNAADGAVIPVSGEISTRTLNAKDRSITIVGMSDDATINSASGRMETYGNITFQNITIKLPTNNDYYGGQDAHNAQIVYDNCKFVGTAAAINGTFVYNDCEFTNPDRYAAWVYNGNVTYNNCSFTGPNRAAKVYAEAGNAPVVIYNNCTFVAATSVDKTAVEIDCSNQTSGTPYYVEINNPTIKNMGVAEHYAIGDGICNLETSGKGLGIVNLNGKSYSVASTAAQLQALTNAGKDVTIEVLEDITGDFTYTQNKEHDLVIDGAGKTMNGTINITARAGKDALGSLVIKNFNFLTTETARDFIRSVETNYYPNNVTVSNCKFEGPSATSDVVPVTLKSSSNFVMEKCTATGVHSLVQNTSGWNLTIRDSQVTNAGRGISLGSCQGVLVENVKIQASNEKYGIRADGAYANTTTIKNCEISSFIPVVVRNASAAYKLVFDGTNTMTAANTDGLWCVIGEGEYEANGVMPTPATGAVTVTLNDAGLSASGVYGATAIQ